MWKSSLWWQAASVKKGTLWTHKNDLDLGRSTVTGMGGSWHWPANFEIMSSSASLAWLVIFRKRPPIVAILYRGALQLAAVIDEPTVNKLTYFCVVSDRGGWGVDEDVPP